RHIYMRRRFLKSLVLAITAIGMAAPLTNRADISVTSGGAGPLTFDAPPVAPDWTTVSLVSAGNTFLDVTSLAAAVQMQTAPLLEAPPTDTADTAHGRAYYNSTAHHLFTHPTGNGASILSATLL